LPAQLVLRARQEGRVFPFRPLDDPAAAFIRPARSPSSAHRRAGRGLQGSAAHLGAPPHVLPCHPPSTFIISGLSFFPKSGRGIAMHRRCRQPVRRSGRRRLAGIILLAYLAPSFPLLPVPLFGGIGPSAFPSPFCQCAKERQLRGECCCCRSPAQRQQHPDSAVPSCCRKKAERSGQRTFTWSRCPCHSGGKLVVNTAASITLPSACTCCFFDLSAGDWLRSCPLSALSCLAPPLAPPPRLSA
jgi:hypothetical protein